MPGRPQPVAQPLEPADERERQAMGAPKYKMGDESFREAAANTRNGGQ